MSTTTNPTTPDLSPVIEQTLNRIDFALQRVYNSQETLGAQLDQIEALLAEFNGTNDDSPSVQVYIEKILKTKDIIEKTQQRVEALHQRAEKVKGTIRDKHTALSKAE